MRKVYEKNNRTYTLSDLLTLTMITPFGYTFNTILENEMIASACYFAIYYTIIGEQMYVRGDK